MICPLSESCLARQNGSQERRPVLKPKAVIPHYTVTAAVLRQEGKILLAQRPADKLLGGMWEFPGGKVDAGESLEECLLREIQEELDTDVRVGNEYGIYKHAYTHFRITVHAFLCELTGGEPRPVQVAALAWVPAGELERYPMGKVDRLIARKIAADGDTISV
jgi:A/G-specific adenine glycosylase